jgi:hypothetical protein
MVIENACFIATKASTNPILGRSFDPDRTAKPLRQSIMLTKEVFLPKNRIREGISLQVSLSSVSANKRFAKSART